jgi:hypothetical protein
MLKIPDKSLFPGTESRLERKRSLVDNEHASAIGGSRVQRRAALIDERVEDGRSRIEDCAFDQAFIAACRSCDSKKLLKFEEE